MDRGTHSASPPTADGYYYMRERLPDDPVAGRWRSTTTATTRPASPTRPTTSPTRPPSWAAASTSACCRSSACRASSTGASSPTPAGTERRHRRHGQLRHDPQRARPALCGRRGLAAGHPGPAGRSLRSPFRAARTRARRAHRTRPETSTNSPPTAATRTVQLLNSYITENWERPGADRNANGDGNCVPRNVDGNPLAFGADATRRPPTPTDCLEGPLMGVQFQTGLLDGRRQLRLRRRLLRTGWIRPRPPDACADGSRADCRSVDADDYLVDVEIPNDARGQPAVQGHQGRGHQHRQRRQDRAADPAAAVRRHAAHRRRRRGRDRRLRPGHDPRGHHRPGVDPDRQPAVRGHRRLPIRGPADAALRHRSWSHVSERPLDRTDVQPASPTCRSRPFLGPARRRPQLLRRPEVPALRREGRHPVRAGRHLRLHEPARHDDRVRLQRPVRRPAAVHQPHQLPDALGRLRQPVPLRRQRPGRARPVEPELQVRTSGRSPPSSKAFPGS